MGAMQWVARKLADILAKEPAWAPPALKQVRTAELEQLKAKCVMPGMTVVVVGNTGARREPPASLAPLALRRLVFY